MCKPLTEEHKDTIVADYLSGVTNKKIIEKYQTYQLYSILNERGIKYKTNIEDKNKKYEKVIELYLNGESISYINKITGCTDTYSILTRFGIEKNRRLSKEIKDAIVEDYLSGMPIRKIAKKYNTEQLYRILGERKIEYKQNNDKQKERQKLVVELYVNNVDMDEIIERTGYKDIYKIIKKFGINRKRNSNKNRKEVRNSKLIEDYLSQQYSMDELSLKYVMTKENIYRILKVYNIKTIGNKTHNWVIHGKARKEPNIKCKFYILENYYGYTKIGITTKSSVRSRFKKNVKIFYELDDNLGFCYDLEVKMKQLLKQYAPTKINRKIDGWSECYTLTPDEVVNLMSFIDNTKKSSS